MRFLSFILVYIIFAAFITAWFLLQQKAGLSFPLPWADEVVFYFSAKNFSDFQRLLTPELNPYRNLMWIPPGFQVVFGLFLPLLDGSYGWARLLTGLMMVSAFTTLLLVCWKLNSKHLNVAFVALGLFSMNSIITGNLVRPEAMVIWLTLSSLALFTYKNNLAALALLLCVPLVHPISLLVVVPLAIIMFLKPYQYKAYRNWWQWLMMGFTITFWLIYAIVLKKNWDFVEGDFLTQIYARNLQNLLSLLFQPAYYISLSLAIIFIIYAALKKQWIVLSLSVAGFGFILVKIIGQGYWYDIYQKIGLLLLAIALVEVLSALWQKYYQHQFKMVFQLLTGLVLAELLLLINVFNPFYGTWSFNGMRLTEKVYITKTETEEIKEKISKLMGEQQGGLFIFYPSGDMCLFAGNMPNNTKPIMPVLHNPVPRYILYHNSAFFTPQMRDDGLTWMRKYLPYIVNAQGFTTTEGTNLTLFTLDNQPNLAADFVHNNTVDSLIQQQ